MKEEARGNFSPVKMFRKGQYHSGAGKEQQTDRRDGGEGLKTKLREGRLSHGHDWFYHKCGCHTFLFHLANWPWY